MPELPEVEVIKRGLLARLPGRRVMAVVCGNRKLRLPVPRARLADRVKGALIQTVERRAKYLLIRMDNGAVAVFHLGMSGKLGLCRADKPHNRHDHLRWLLDNGLELRFNDSRRFGSVQVLSTAELHTFFTRTGPEPFGDDFSGLYLAAKADGRVQPVKNFLMDSRIVAGIGNIYASEILFAAGINPRTPAGYLDRKRWEKVVKACRKVLARAIAGGGTTIADFVNCDGDAGYFQLQLKVYGRAGEPCRICRTPVEKIVLAGRATYFCRRCQL